MSRPGLPELGEFPRADDWMATEGKGRWRKARKRLRCDRFFWARVEACRGTGWIEPGTLYFDTQEMDPDRAGGFGTRRACGSCCR